MALISGRVGVVGTIAIGVATWAAVAFGLQTVTSRGSAEAAAEDAQ